MNNISGMQAESLGKCATHFVGEMSEDAVNVVFPVQVSTPDVPLKVMVSGKGNTPAIHYEIDWYGEIKVIDS